MFDFFPANHLAQDVFCFNKVLPDQFQFLQAIIMLGCLLRLVVLDGNYSVHQRFVLGVEVNGGEGVEIVWDSLLRYALNAVAIVVAGGAVEIPLNQEVTGAVSLFQTQLAEIILTISAQFTVNWPQKITVVQGEELLGEPALGEPVQGVGNFTGVAQSLVLINWGFEIGPRPYFLWGGGGGLLLLGERFGVSSFLFQVKEIVSLVGFAVVSIFG